MTPGLAIRQPGAGRALRRRALAALVFGLAGAVVSLAQAQPVGAMAPMGPHGLPAYHGMGPAQAWAPMMTERMLEAAGASPEQKTKVREILKSAHDDLAKLRVGAPDLRQQMMALMVAPQVDAAAAEALRQQMMARHDAASKRLLQAMLEASAVLTPEQRQKLAERMKARRDMMQRHQRERQAIEPRS